MVLKRCIYGVDLNEMAVELAKLSLWLKKVEKRHPLNFLYYYLRCSIFFIDSRINYLNYLPRYCLP